MNWDGLEQHRIDLKLPLLLIRGSRGVLACGYLAVATFDKTGEAAAIVTGVRSFDDMLVAKVTAVSTSGAAAGLQVGMTGAEVLDVIR
ncbi:hypothetical protein VT84_34885 [Gemmata sp. SH-PL17]|uniref:YunC family protein n=1 Tax=Gemmata sp. SH-PL17 TaxID=1630693 RepID=UPI00078D3565|nr:DUF1805 domain-containing protein [Gemmata sp. SH-PL17]AMV29633.1 hypothetical protein VT84_34885 [Gemmata sp. SH-PL17]